MKWIFQLLQGIILMSRAVYTLPQPAAMYNEVLPPDETTAEEPLPPPFIPDGCQEEYKPAYERCEFCFCDDWSGPRQWVCRAIQCLSLTCENPIREPGQCCDTCPLPTTPSEKGCLIADVMLQIGDVHQMDDGDLCICGENSSFSCSSP